MFVTLLGAALCAILLHQVGDRGAAVAILPVAGAWGVAAVLGGPRLPDSRIGLFVAALAVRMVLVGTPPLLSDDLYRYLWEGTALWAGHDPFLEAPATISGLDDLLRAKVNHPEISSIYPPLALTWFRLLALGGTPAAVQLMTGLADATVPLAIHTATRRSGPAWVYALHPLAALESAQGGHLDLLAVALAAWAIAAWRRGRLDLSFALATAGALAKLFPVVFLPALMRRATPSRNALRIALTLLVTVLLAWPVLDAGPRLFEGMRVYATTWEFDGFAYPWLAPWLGGWTRPVLVACGALAAGWALWTREDPGEVWLVAGAAFVLLSPTVHPWYVVWALVPALLCGRYGWAAAAVPLLGKYAVLATFDPATGAWTEAGWIWWITWPPALLLLSPLPLSLPLSLTLPIRRSEGQGHDHDRNEATPTAP